MVDHMLTTVDNPFDPFTSFREWFVYDATLGYHTPEYLARVTRTSDDLSEQDQSIDIERAIDEVVSEHAGGLYKKVTKES